MGKWIGILAASFMVVGFVFAAPVGDEVAPAPSSTSLSSGDGTPTEPVEAMADTTADIYIYVTLRQPEGPPAPNFYIFDEGTTPGNEYIWFKADVGPNPAENRDFYLVYRAQWALFNWQDVRMLGGSDTSQMIDPIEDFAGRTDAGEYRWGGPTAGYPDFTYDFFYDTLWTTDPGVKGVGDPTVNWFYTACAVDSSETDGRLFYSPEPAHPVGEFDQWLGCATAGANNLLSYAVEMSAVSDSGNTATSFARLIPNCKTLWEWDAVNQRWILIARKIGSLWLNSGNVRLGNCYLAVLDETVVSPGDTFVFSQYTPGYLPMDTCFYFTKPSSWSDGANFFVMPYQEYNILASAYGFPVEAKYLGMDIDATDPGIQPVSVWRWDPFSQRYILIARKIGSLWLTSGGAHIYPGQPYRVQIQGDGGYWPVCP